MCILFNKHGNNLAFQKPPDSVLRPRVRRYGLKTLLCIFWNSSAVPDDRVSEMSQMATHYAKYHKLTKFARNFCYHCDKTSENCGPLRLEENAHGKSKKNYFSTLNCYACRHSPYSFNLSSNDLHSFRSLQSVLAEKYSMTSRR